MDPKNRQGTAGKRVALAVGIGLVTLVAAFLAGAGWTVALSLSWIAAAFISDSLLLYRVVPMNSADTAVHAQAEDYSRRTSDLVLLSASAASLVAVAFILVDARHHSGTEKGLLIALAISVVALSWTTVHLVYTVRYGDIFYADPVGGVTFNQDEKPNYRDFAYLAFTIGMTYQVSDTSLTNTVIRRAVSRHALLSYLFGAVIVALAINTVSSLLQ
jgi:uncharacterized membrane protein